MTKFIKNFRKLCNLLTQDFVRHQSSVRELQFLAMANYRFGQWVWTLPKPLETVGSKFYGAGMLGIELLTGIVIHRETQIGENLHLVHSGNIKIHPHAVIGKNVGIMHDVTIGQCSTKLQSKYVPVIGDNVFIGAGAKILGRVKIGDGAVIAANSLVITDVPPGETVMGVPAVPLRCAFKALLQAKTEAREVAMMAVDAAAAGAVRVAEHSVVVKHSDVVATEETTAA